MYKPPNPPVPFSLPYRSERFAWALEVIGWSKDDLCYRMDLDRGLVREYLRGWRRIPDALGMWLESLAQMHLTFNKPFNWRDKPGVSASTFGGDLDDLAQDPDTISLDNEKV